MRKRLTGVLIVCAVSLSVNLTPSREANRALAAYGDKNEYTETLTVLIAIADNVKDYGCCAFEGKDDFEAVILVEQAWNPLSQRKRLLLAKDILAGWMQVRGFYGYIRLVDKNGTKVGGVEYGEVWVVE